MCVCVRACVRVCACVRACVCVCVRTCVYHIAQKFGKRIYSLELVFDPVCVLLGCLGNVLLLCLLYMDFYKIKLFHAAG